LPPKIAKSDFTLKSGSVLMPVAWLPMRWRKKIAELGSGAGETGIASGQVLNSAQAFKIESAHLKELAELMASIRKG
jgi:hypothetical protein